MSGLEVLLTGEAHRLSPPHPALSCLSWETLGRSLTSLASVPHRSSVGPVSTVTKFPGVPGAPITFPSSLCWGASLFSQLLPRLSLLPMGWWSQQGEGVCPGPAGQTVAQRAAQHSSKMTGRHCLLLGGETAMAWLSPTPTSYEPLSCCVTKLGEAATHMH